LVENQSASSENQGTFPNIQSASYEFQSALSENQSASTKFQSASSENQSASTRVLPFNTPEEALTLMSIIDALYASAATKQPVRVVGALD
jgi:hypothetical protein